MIEQLQSPGHPINKNMIDRPLWQLLLVCKNEEMLAERPLTCGECFTILEYLAEKLTRKPDNSDSELLRKEVMEHLEACPNCDEFYQQQLKVLESSISKG